MKNIFFFRNIRIFLGVVILISLGGVSFMVWRTIAPFKEKNTAVKDSAVSADLTLDRVHYTETREGIKEWELEASSAVYFKNENIVLFDKVKATFFGKNQDIYYLKGEKGKFNTQTKAIEVFDGVRLDSSNGYHLRTKSLRYQAEKKELTTSDPVDMSGPQLQVKGIGLVVELDNQRFRVLNQVSTTLSQEININSFGAVM